MKYISYGKRKTSVIVAGCMRIGEFTEKAMDAYINSCLNMGINYFDHADIYGGGRCEQIFGAYLHKHPKLRDEIYIQSKCGIRDGYYDLSYKHIVSSVEGILSRLQTDHIDSLLLHRPDALMEPAEINKAFTKLYKEGKVLSFGVSNMNPQQIEMLQKSLNFRLLVDQVELSLAHTPMLDAGFNVNMDVDHAIMRDGGTLEYLRTKGMGIQIWSPLQMSNFAGTFLNTKKYERLNYVMTEMAHKYDCGKSTIAYAWLLRYPAMMQIIVGSTKTEHIRSAVRALDIRLSKEEWYTLYKAAGHELP